MIFIQPNIFMISKTNIKKYLKKWQFKFLLHYKSWKIIWVEIIWVEKLYESKLYELKLYEKQLYESKLYEMLLSHLKANRVTTIMFKSKQK